MREYTKGFIICSITYFLIGTLLGTLFFFVPEWMKFKPIHIHLNLLGFMSMMIYGVLYHVLPRFSGKPLFSEKLATAHLYIGNLTFILFMLAMAIFYQGALGWSFQFVGFFALFHWLTIALFVTNIFLTLIKR